METRVARGLISRSGMLLASLFLVDGLLLATPTFQLLGDLPGGSDYAVAFGVSADGTYVVGESSSTLSGPIDPVRISFNREAFIWDATAGMTGLGDLAGGIFSSTATDVNAGGTVVVGRSIELSEGFQHRWVPFSWTRTGNMVKPASFDFAAITGARFGFAGATAVSSNPAGPIAVGTIEWQNETTRATFSPGFLQNETTRATFSRGFLWFPGFARPPDIFLSPTEQSTANAVISSPIMTVGAYAASGPPLEAYRHFGAQSARGQPLGRVGNGATEGRAISADGKTIVGSFVTAAGTGTFRWRESPDDFFSGTFVELRASGAGGIGVSADGRVILDAAGGLYLDTSGPHDLREILAAAGVVDLRGLVGSQFLVHALSDDGLVVVGAAFLDGKTQAWRVRLTDCDANGLPDEVERRAHPGLVLSVAVDGSQRFASSRGTLGYGNMISHYGRPWQPGTSRTPTRNPDEPAEYLRALGRVPDCPGGAFVGPLGDARSFFFDAALPAARELHAFEMLLGNEALADALDPLVGLQGIAAADLGDEYAFKGVRGIDDLLDEELALLRGRELPGSPADWSNETVYYPEYTSATDEKVRAAVYNRLPPNAEGFDGRGYISNYGVATQYDAALKFPQGHGDAYGHFLSALRTGIEFLSVGPEGFPADLMAEVLSSFGSDDTALANVRDLSVAAVARAETAAALAEVLFRRDYWENPEHPRAADLFVDSDPERAWSMADWCRRGALGAYLDWAVVNQLAPSDEERPVNRGELAELGVLAAVAGSLQERLDTAGAGLDPLGLVQNVVPFGIDASGLEPGTGRSHYEQVREAASRALDNARQALEIASQADQRLRDADKTIEDFTDQLEDLRADFDQQLIEVFGLPSPDDPADNDLDPSTSNFQESQSHPDLTNFLASDEDLAAAAMRPRQAPGEVQIALSELRVAALRLEQAELLLDNHAAEIRGQVERIELVTGIQVERLKILATACDDLIALTDRLEEIEERRKDNGLFGSFTKAALGAFTGDAGGIVDFASQLVTTALDATLPENEFDIERERTRVQCHKEAALQGLEDLLSIDNERRELEARIRRTPQLLVDRAVQSELAKQALGRLHQTINRGQLLLKRKRRLDARTEGDLLEERWKDVSFRVFRNAALKNYRALFDLAARYVVLATRAYAYEFDKRSDGEDVLSGIYRERRLGSAVGLDGGLQAVLQRLDASVTVNNFNRPLESLGERSFSLRRNLLGIGVQNFPNDDLEFRAFVEQSIVERVEDLNEIRELAQVSVQRDYGPGIVISFLSEIDGRNFFGNGPDLPFGNANFSLTRNAKIRSFAVRFDGVDSAVGIDPQSGTVFVYLIPAGDSVLRENTNKPRIEDELATPWAVVDQYLPVPPIASASEVARRSYNPWRATAQAGGNFLNEIKRQRDTEAQIELGQPLRFNTHLAGRSAWNTRWLLVIPGSQWTSSSDPSAIRRKLLQFIYGIRAEPAELVGMTDIRLVIQAYSH